MLFHDPESACPKTLDEILYDPDLPAFKCISVSVAEDIITQKLRGILASILDEDTDIVELPSTASLDDDIPEDTADIAIISDQPRVIPWGVLNRGTDLGAEYYDCYCFPDNITDMEHKKIWRGLELRPGCTIDQVISFFAQQWAHNSAPGDLQSLASDTGCFITHNMKGDVIYAGSDLGVEYLDKALQVLQTLTDMKVG